MNDYWLVPRSAIEILIRRAFIVAGFIAYALLIPSIFIAATGGIHHGDIAEIAAGFCVAAGHP